MTRKLTIVTDCGHRYNRGLAAADVAGCTLDCRVCGELLIIPAETIETRFPLTWEVVRARRFHHWMHSQDPRWSVDGASTGYVEFDLGGDA